MTVTPFDNLSFDQKNATHEEVRIALDHLKFGLKLLRDFSGLPSEFHAPLLLLTSGFERLLKLILCLDFLNRTGGYPDWGAFSVRWRSHRLRELLRDVVLVMDACPRWQSASALKDDRTFVSSDSDLLELIQLMQEFGSASRYHNLDVITSKPDPERDPEQVWKDHREAYWDKVSPPDYIPDSSEFHDRVNIYWIALLQRLARALSRMFTFDALGDTGRRSSVVVISNPFLTLDDRDLVTLKW